MVDEDGEADGAEVVPAGAVHDPHDGDPQGEGLRGEREICYVINSQNQMFDCCA